MPEPVELKFEESGVDELTDKVERLAKALDALPKSGILRISAGGGGSAPSPTRAPSTAAMLNPIFQGGSPAAPIPANATAGAYRTQATAVAKAAASATTNVQGLASAIGSLHPVAALAVAGLTAVVAGVASLQQRNLSSIQSDFLWGKASGASARGVAESLGTDPVAGPQGLQSAIDSDRDVRNEAINAGVNPNGSIYGGDTDYATKYKRMLDYLSDRVNGEKDAQKAAYIANKAGVGDKVAELSAMPEEDRRAALDNRVDISEGDQSEAAKRQVHWNKLGARVKHAADVAAAWALDTALAGVNGIEGLDRLLDGKNPFPTGKDAKGDGPKAAEKMDDAADKMGRAAQIFSQAAEGIGGGGSRSRNAFPPGWGYIHFDHAAHADAARLGVN